MRLRPGLVSQRATTIASFLLFTVATSLFTFAQLQKVDQSEPPARVLVKEGTEVKLKLAKRLSSKTAAEGDPVNFVLDQDLRVADALVARAGSVAVGTISHASRSGALGRPGDLGVRLEYLGAGDSRVGLRGSKGKQGKGREGTTVVLTVLFGPVGLIKHGKDAELQPGVQLTAYVDRDTELSTVE